MILNFMFHWDGAGVDVGRGGIKIPKFLVIGHRGSGMNLLQSSDRRMKAMKENSVLSFNAAAKFAVDFIEFDVQVKFPGTFFSTTTRVFL